MGELIADANGEIKVYINDTGTLDGDDRTWYDGLSYRSGLAYSGTATMTVDGNFSLDAGTTLAMDIGNPLNHDQLKVSGTATLGGTLHISLVERRPITGTRRYF